MERNERAHSVLGESLGGRGARGVASWLIGVVVVLCVVIGVPATAQSTSGTSLVVDPIEPRIDAIAGSMLVVPVRVVGDTSGVKTLQARLDDGRKVESLLRCISVRLDRGAGATWLPPAATWTVDTKPASDGEGREGIGATWVLVMQLPADAAGQNVWVGNSKLPLNWLPAPSALVRSNDRFGWPAPMQAAKLTPELRALLAPEAESPVRRWRHRLLTTGLDPRREAEQRLTLGLSEFPDPILEALARQSEGRWSVAIAWLWRDRPELAQRLAWRVACVVDFGEGHVAPAWPIDQADLDALVSDLVDPDLSTDGRIARAETWLKSQEPMVAWLADDGGQSSPDPDDESLTNTVSSVMIANMTDRGVTVAAGPPGAKPELMAIDPLRVTALAAVIPGTSRVKDEQNEAGGSLVLSSGSWGVSLSPLADRVPVRPPGRKFGGLRADLTIRSWRSPSSVESASTLPETRAVLARGSPVSGGDDSWFLMVECRRVSLADDPSKDRVEVWIGPREHPRLVVQLAAIGEATLIQAERPDEMRSIAERVRFVKEESRWAAFVPIDDAFIEPESLLRIGLVRVDARGVRGSWPRAMLPWQVEPSRVLFSLREWGGLSGR
ncbi:MAG: hypothetical protein IT432_11765 [Phycisphaerales bacterium]|nr:hypothetical protein [Phycisphaerales bacterium]